MIENLLTFYDIKTGIPLKEELIDLKKDGSISTTVYRLECFHEYYSFSCCIGIKFLWLKGPVCVTAGLDLENIGIFIKLTLKQKSIFHKSISCKYFYFFFYFFFLKNIWISYICFKSNFETRNILCVTVKNPEFCINIGFGKIHLIKFCIKIHDISISNHNLHFCIDLKIKILFKTKQIKFNCINIKTKGINLDNFALELERFDQTEQQVIEFTYDEEDLDLKDDLEDCIDYISAYLIPEKAQKTISVKNLDKIKTL